MDDLSLAGPYNADGGSTAWYDETDSLEVLIGDKATNIDKESKTILSESGKVSSLGRGVWRPLSP